MPKTDIASGVQEIIARELGRNPGEINLETDLSNLDDLEIMCLILALEERYIIRVSDRRFERLIGPGITEFMGEPMIESRVVKVNDFLSLVREQLSRQRHRVLSSQVA